LQIHSGILEGGLPLKGIYKRQKENKVQRQGLTIRSWNHPATVWMLGIVSTRIASGLNDVIKSGWRGA
jgi:hypothetical protein